MATSFHPSTVMTAARVHRYGRPDVISIDSIPIPKPGAGEVLVAIHAAAVNFPDVLTIAGQYQVQQPLPFIPGHEAAGIVVALGSGVEDVTEGDRVAVLGTKAFAEYVTVSADSTVPIPEGVSFAEAAGTWVCHLGAYHACRSTAGISHGENVLVLGAGGGLGLAAVEIAALLGATVIAAASSQDKLEAARLKGAAITVNYRDDDLREKVREAIGLGKVDVVLDPVGGSHAESALRELAWGGRFITLGYASGEIPRIPLNLVLLKGAEVKGMEMRTFAAHDPVSAARDRTEFTALWNAGRIRPLIHRRFPLSRTGEALRNVENRMSVGKTIIDVVPEQHPAGAR